MARVKNQTVPIDLQSGLNQILRFTKTVLSNVKTASTLPSATTSKSTTKEKTELAAGAADSATWLANAWIGARGTEEWSAFYADRFNEVMTKTLAPPYWRSLAVAWDKTAIATPSIHPFGGTTNPAYSDSLRQPTDCRYETYDRIYTTPSFPSMESNKSPGWQGAVNADFFEDLWTADRIIAFTIPTAQQTNTRRPILLNVSSNIQCTATIRGNKVWFALCTQAQVNYSYWTPGRDDRPVTHYNPSWKFNGPLPGDSPGGWLHNETITTWRYGSWKLLGKQYSRGNVVLITISTPPSLGRYYSRNDSVTILHNDTAAVWWPQRPGEM